MTAPAAEEAEEEEGGEGEAEAAPEEEAAEDPPTPAAAEGAPAAGERAGVITAPPAVCNAVEGLAAGRALALLGSVLTYASDSTFMPPMPAADDDDEEEEEEEDEMPPSSRLIRFAEPSTPSSAAWEAASPIRLYCTAAGVGCLAPVSSRAAECAPGAGGEEEEDEEEELIFFFSLRSPSLQNLRRNHARAPRGEVMLREMISEMRAEVQKTAPD